MKHKKTKKKSSKKNKYTIAYLAGGCFWSIEKELNKLKGVLTTKVGYMGGNKKNPTYEEVLSDKTGHIETVMIKYNKYILSYENLLKYFLNMIQDKSPPNKYQYSHVVFYTNKYQKSIYQRLERLYNLKSVKLLSKKKFYLAEDYHQMYSFKKECKSLTTENIQVFNTICKNNKNLAEKKGSGKYLYNTTNGNYYCACCGIKLYNSSKQYDSKTGWPAFTSEISKKNILFDTKTSELRCGNCGLHLGHRTFDGPSETKQHDCINSACLNFKSKSTDNYKKITSLGRQWIKEAEKDMKKRQNK